MLKHSAEIVAGLMTDFLEVVLEDTNAKEPCVLVIRFPIDVRTGALDLSCFTCCKTKELAIQSVAKELFWVYHFVLEFRDWKSHLDEYDDFCSNRL